MSLSLPHHTQQVPPQLPPPGAGPATAAVTRILVLSDFSPSLKTRDLQGVFQPWEAERGGFRVKWIDDVTALVVFQDATVAKRAYLSLLLNPPPALPYPATIKPYDGPDAQAIIHSVAARQHGQQRASMSGSGAGVMSGAMAQGIVLSAGTNGGFGAGSREPPLPQSGITGYGHARTGSRVQQQQQQQQGDPSSINAAMTGLGITTYPRHGRSASTSSLSASEPLHGSAARAGGAESYAIGSSGGGGAGVGRIIGGAGAHGRHGSSGSSAFGRNSAMGAFAFGGKESTTASTGGFGRAGKDATTTTTGSGNGPINEEPSSSTTPTTNNNVPAPPVASSAAFRSSVSGARGTGTTQGLATHHETDSPTGTPTKTSASGSSPNARAGDTAAAAAAHGQAAGTTEEVGTPGIEILGAVPFPEGGPGGYLASKERRASSGKALSVGDVTVAEVFGNVRRESLDAKSAEKALREVSRALEGLGVGVGVAAAAGKS